MTPLRYYSALPAHQSLAPGIHRGLGAIGQVELAQQVADVCFHRALGDDQLVGDLGVAASLGDEVEHLHLPDLDIGGCRSCYLCQKTPSKLECALDDDGMAVLRSMTEADVIVYASPLYCWGFTAQMKPIIDRHYCLVTGYADPSAKVSHVAGRRAGLLVTCAGPDCEGNTDTIIEIFERLCDFCSLPIAGELILGMCTAPDELGTGRERAVREFARDLVE